MTTKANEDLKMNAKELLDAAQRVEKFGALVADENQQVIDELKAAKALRASVEDRADELLKAQSQLVLALAEEQANLEKAVLAVQATLEKARLDIHEAQEVLNRFEFDLAFSGATQEIQELETSANERKTHYHRLTVELDGLVSAIRHAAKD